MRIMRVRIYMASAAESSSQEKLTAKQEEFCQQYLVDLNGTQAAIRAGYSKDTATVIACENLTKPNIQQRISELMAIRSERTHVSQDRVVKELARLGFADMRDYAEWDRSNVKLKDSSLLDADQAACIESIGQTVSQHGGSISFKLHSKPKALELLASHLGMIKSNVRVGNPDGTPLRIVPQFIVSNQAIADTMKELIDNGGRKKD
jgi:phage terminase small subunit